MITLIQTFLLAYAIYVGIQDGCCRYKIRKLYE